MDPTLIRIHPCQTQVHPILSGFPDLPPDEYAALKLSIKEKGILVPLRGVMTPDPEGKKRWRVDIFSGRHRRKIALELGLQRIPIVTNNGVTLLDFVIDEAVTGRQLTKSGVALVLFEKHPALAKAGRGRKPIARKRDNGRSTANIAADDDNGRSAAITAGNGDAQEESFRQISERYSLPRDYFVILTKIKHGVSEPGYPKLPPATEEQWSAVKRAIIEDRVALTRIFAGYNGEVATRGKHRADPTYLMLDRNGNLRGLMPEALTSLRNGFSQWSKLDFAARGKLREAWLETVESLPEDLREIGNPKSETRKNGGRK
jgi:hypothetical protein